MIFGQPVTIPRLITALKQQLAGDTGLSITSIFASLAEDVDLLQAPVADRFIAIRPGKFPADQPTAAGGGRDLSGFNSTWRIAVFARLKTDQEFKSERLLMDGQGPLSLVWSILRGSLSSSGQQGGQMFTPLDSDGHCVLREPGRLGGFDLDAKRMTGANDSTWWVIPTYWEFKFTADLT